MPTRRRRLASFALAVLALACVPAQPLDPASLQGTRRLVSVTYPSPQTLQARAAGRDTTLHRVSDILGWPAGVRGDTVDVQLARWRADRRRHEMRPTDYVVAVPASANAVIRPAGEPSSGPVFVVLGAIAVLAVVIALIDLDGLSGG